VPLGIYISVPFCRTKCSYCNFASGVFSRAVFERYLDRVCADIENAQKVAEEMGGRMQRAVDSIYLGGGTPTVLDAAQLERVFATVRSQFVVKPEAEVTVECAPGTLTGAMLESLLRCGVNRMSLGVQSFVDQEAAAVGRMHKRATVLEDIVRLGAAGITNINIDLIAGLPDQTAESWEFSLAETIATGASHVSVYMLEVDQDSRLGRELLAGGTRYHAHLVPDEEAIADFYRTACERLQSAGIAQYEISNFAREGFESQHNLKYWTRQPYFGFGVDAHSMLDSATEDLDAGFPTQRRTASTEEDGARFRGARDCAQRHEVGRAWRTFPLETVKELGKLGLLGTIFPTEYGGAGMGYVEYVTAIEELSRVDGSVGIIVAAHTSLGSNHIFVAGNEEQKRNTSAKLATGEFIGAWGLTEPGSGSDAGGAR
jgi:putative oxygen-independent coproporphyrinogen III oxidase